MMYGKQITFRLEKELYRKLEKVAAKDMRSVGGLIRLILSENLKKYETARVIKLD